MPINNMQGLHSHYLDLFASSIHQDLGILYLQAFVEKSVNM